MSRGSPRRKHRNGSTACTTGFGGFGEAQCPATPDCYDAASTCTQNCTTDADNDGRPDCQDLCIDADGDGYENGEDNCPNDTNASQRDSNASCPSTCGARRSRRAR